MWLVLDPLNPLCGLSYTQGGGEEGEEEEGKEVGGERERESDEGEG